MKDKLLITGLAGSVLLILGLIALRIGIIGFLLWLAYKLVMHYVGG